MDSVFARMLETTTPKMNEPVITGLGGFFMKSSEQFLDGIFRDLSRGFPAELQYDGISTMSPEEMMYETTRARAGSKRSVDIAPADTYMVRVRFNWMGEHLVSLPLLLLYTDRHGIFQISGKKRHIVPVLNHRVLAPATNTIFLRVSKAKITFRKIFHSISINGLPTAVDLPFGNIYQSKGKLSPEKKLIQSKAETLIMHYLLAKYGFEETFRAFAGFVPIIGKSEINVENYPPELFTIVEYCGLKPSTAIKGLGYMGTEIKMAIPNEHWTNAMKVMVAGTYYIIDHFPDEIQPEEVNDPYKWIIFLGYILQSPTYVHGKLYREMTAHLSNLDEHLDLVHREKLSYLNIHVENFYSLLAYVNNNFEELIRTGSDGVTGVYNKIIEVLHDVYEPVIHGFNAVGFAVTKMIAKQPANQIDRKNLINTIRDEFRPGRIYKTANKPESLVSDAAESCNSLQYFKISSKTNQQEAVAMQSSTGSRRQVGPSSRHHPSHVDFGSILFLPKKKPVATSRLNPYSNVGLDGSINPNPNISNIVEALAKHYRCGDNQLIDAESAEMMQISELE